MFWFGDLRASRKKKHALVDDPMKTVGWYGNADVSRPILTPKQSAASSLQLLTPPRLLLMAAFARAKVLLHTRAIAQDTGILGPPRRRPCVVRPIIQYPASFCFLPHVVPLGCTWPGASPNAACSHPCCTPTCCTPTPTPTPTPAPTPTPKRTCPGRLGAG